MTWLLILAAPLFLGVLLWVFILRSRTRLSPSERERLRTHWERAAAQEDLHRRILDADSVLDQLLTALGYSGTLGEKLKRAGPRLPQLQSVWDAHKLRNRIAHEANATITGDDALRAMRAFERVIRQFLD